MKKIFHILIAILCILFAAGCVSNGAKDNGPQIVPTVDPIDVVQGDKKITEGKSNVASFQLHKGKGHTYAVRTKVTVNLTLTHEQTGESSVASKTTETLVFIPNDKAKTVDAATEEGRNHGARFSYAQADQETVKILKVKILAYLKEQAESRKKAKKNQGQIGQVHSYQDWLLRSKRQVVQNQQKQGQEQVLAVVENGNSTSVASTSIEPIKNVGGEGVALQPLASLKGKIDGRLIKGHAFENKAISTPSTDPEEASGVISYGARAGFDIVSNENGVSYLSYEAVEVGSRLNFLQDRVSFYSLFQAEHGLDWMKGQAMNLGLKGEAGVDAWLTRWLAVGAYTSVQGNDVIANPLDVDAFTGGRVTALAGGFTFSVTSEVQIFGIDVDNISVLDTLKTGFLGTYENESLKFSVKMTQFHIAMMKPEYRALSKFELFAEKTFNPEWSFFNKSILSAEIKGNLNPEIDLVKLNSYSETKAITGLGNLIVFSGTEVSFENGGNIFWGGLYGFKGQMGDLEYKVAADTKVNFYDWEDNTSGLEVVLGSRKSAFFAKVRAEVEDFDFATTSISAEASVFIVEGTELFGEGGIADISDADNFSAFLGIRHALGEYGYVGVQGGYDPETETVAKFVVDFGGEAAIY